MTSAKKERVRKREHHFGAIQIIRDTLGGVSKVSRELFAFKSLILSLLEVKNHR